MAQIPGDDDPKSLDLRALPTPYETSSPLGPVECSWSRFWLLRRMHKQDTTPTRRHLWWRQVMDLGSEDLGIDGHHFLGELLERECRYNSLHLSELAVLEVIARRHLLQEDYFGDSPAAGAIRTDSTSAGEGDERYLLLGHKMGLSRALAAPLLQERNAS